MPKILQLGPQLAEVVNFSVKHDNDRSIFVGNWLVASYYIDDCQTGDREPRDSVNIISVTVRSSVAERRVKPPQKTLIRTLARL
jgi:hypothetical protein